MAVRVEREAHIRMQQAAVKMLRTMNAVLLRNREDDLQWAVWQSALAQLPQRFRMAVTPALSSAPRMVVPSERMMPFSRMGWISAQGSTQSI